MEQLCGCQRTCLGLETQDDGPSRLRLLTMLTTALLLHNGSGFLCLGRLCHPGDTFQLSGEFLSDLSAEDIAEMLGFDVLGQVPHAEKETSGHWFFFPFHF
jgi:hypothetical protein